MSRPSTSAEAALIAAASAAVLLGGGFSAGAQALFAALAGLALVLVPTSAVPRLRRATRSPVVAGLVGLGLLSMLSSTWTAGEPGDAIVAGLVMFGIAATTVVVAAVGPDRLLRALLVLAAAAATIGLIGVAFRALPVAERIGGAWRPGGPFQYSSALALFEVCAVALLLPALRQRGRWAAAGLALAVSVIALSGSRACAGLAVGIFVVAYLAPERMGMRRQTVVAAAGLAGLCAAGAYLAAGGYEPPRATGGELMRLTGLALVPALAAAAWPFFSRIAIPRAVVIAAVAAVAAVGVSSAALGVAQQRGIEPAGGIAHGRTDHWRAALHTGLERPVLGAGAGAYLVASREHQGAHVVRYAHSTPLELWAELGAVGLLLLTTSLAAAVMLVLRAGAALPASLAAIAIAVHSLGDWSLHFAGIAVVLGVLLGALLRAAESGAKGPGQGSSRDSLRWVSTTPPSRKAGGGKE